MSELVEGVWASSAPELADLHARCFEVGWSAQDISSLLVLPGCTALACRRDDAFVAMAMFRRAVDEAELLTLATDPEHRRQGLAERVLAQGEASLEKQGVVRVFLEVSERNSGAHALYERCGYREIACRRAYYRDGSDARVLEKWLRNDGQTAP